MHRLRRLVMVTFALAALASCGNKGPLVLPDDAVAPAATVAPASAASVNP